MRRGQDWPGEAIGRSRGATAEAGPLAFTLTAGNINDCTQFEAVMERHPHHAVWSRPPQETARTGRGRQGYSSAKIRSYLRRRSIEAAIPERLDQVNGRLHRGASRCHLNRVACRRRNAVERCFNRLEHNKAWPPATTNEPATTKPWSPSPAYGSGSPDIADTTWEHGQHLVRFAQHALRLDLSQFAAQVGGAGLLRPGWSGAQFAQWCVPVGGAAV